MTDTPPEAAPAEGGLASDQVDPQKVQEAANIFSTLLKGIKNIGIYRHNESRFPEYLEPTHRLMAKFLSEEHQLPLKLGPYTLEWKKQVIYEEQSKENLTYRFYRDGMRFLVFREGVTVEELLRFVLLAIQSATDAQLQQEDMITRLWKENFQCIEYVVVEGFGFGDLSEEQVEIEVEKIVGYLRKQLAANSADITRFARLNVEDLELELNDIEQVRGGIISGRPASTEDHAWVQQELLTEEKKRLFAKMVLILFQILERDCNANDYDVMSDAFVQVLDTLIISEDVRGSVAVLHRFDQIASRPDLSEERRGLVNRIRDTFAKRMAEPQRVQAVGQYMTLAKQLDEVAVKAYFSVLSPDAIQTLLEMFDTMERPEGRKILIDVLSVLGKNHASVFADRLENKSSNVVKDMLTIIDKIDPPDKLDLYARCLDHPNIMIRLEGLKIIGRTPGDAAMKHIEKAMGDSDMQMRLGAYRALVTKNAEKAAPVLKKLMKSDNYLSLDHREQVAIAVALGETRSKEALEFFGSTFQEKGTLFTKGKTNEMKQLAIRGLIQMKTVPAFQMLAKEVQNRNNSKEIIEAAHKAALRLKAELTGQPAPAGPGGPQQQQE